MRRRKLTIGGFVLGAILGACLLNVPAEHQGFFTMFADYSAMPLMILLSPLLFLTAPAGLFAFGHAFAAVLTWTAIGYAADLVANQRN